MKVKILFRADGNNETGLGHLYRLIALVEIYKDYFNFVFVTKNTSTKTVLPQSYQVVFMPDNITIIEEPQWLKNNFDIASHVIIADGYQFNTVYQKELKTAGFRFIYIDDLVKYHMYADVVVNHSPNININSYQKESYTKITLGPQYAILRPLFIRAAQKLKHVSNSITSVFVCFGGADTLDLSFKSTQALLQIDSIRAIHIVLGAAYNHSSISELANKNKDVKVYRNLDEIALYELMDKCQLAIAPSSTIAYELCAVKIPMLSGYFVDNQKNIYAALLKEGAIHGGGDFSRYTVQDFKRKLEEMIKQEDFNHYLKAQQNLFDGQSKNRFLKLLNDLLISFRKADVDDMLLVFNWSNDPLVRLNSYNTEEIDLDRHEKWFNHKINDGKTLFLIALFDNQPAGVVRYEIKEDHAIIGVLIAEDYRGKRLSPSFLSESAKKYFKQNHLPIFAYIKEDNKASKKAFENAGYFFYKKENVQGKLSFVYKLEKKDVTG